MSVKYSKNDIKFLSEIEKNHYWYVCRRKMIHAILEQILPMNEPKPRILDLGCGSGSMFNTARKHGEYLGIEYDAKAAANCKQKGAQVIIGDGMNIPLKDESFDLIMLLDCLEHVEEDRQILNECYRVLIHEGLILISVPAFRILWTTFDEHSYHIRRYNCSDLIKLLENNDIKTIKVTHLFFYQFPVLLMIALLERFGFKKKDRQSGWRERLKPPPLILNKLLILLGQIEVFLTRWVSIPLGSSLIVLCEKINQADRKT
ncbi:MAG: class I SAM-dependent methyltransferase [Candidatus Helarchaeota archaeon]